MAYWVITSSFQPFDDSIQRTYKLPLSGTEDGINTTAIDSLRQGIELNSSKHLFSTTQPKLWGGELKKDGFLDHERKTRTYGEPLSVGEFLSNQKFNDNSQIFNAYGYIINGSGSFPLEISDPGLFQNESLIEVFTSPFRFKNEANYITRSFHANLEDGNALDGLGKGNSRIEQLIEFNPMFPPRPFLDNGERRFGETLSGSIIIPGDITTIQRKINPFVDQFKEYVVSQITSSQDPTFSGSLLALNYTINGEIIEINKKSSTAGRVQYGPNQAKYGTDSLAYIGRLRGS